MSRSGLESRSYFRSGLGVSSRSRSGLDRVGSQGRVSIRVSGLEPLEEPCYYCCGSFSNRQPSLKNYSDDTTLYLMLSRPILYLAMIYEANSLSGSTSLCENDSFKGYDPFLPMMATWFMET
uniref:Uncharacterized protein n=1 Tax=Solanum tuberosum TaxID=4113 RepID=M1DGU1_SOLTU